MHSEGKDQSDNENHIYSHESSINFFCLLFKNIYQDFRIIRWFHIHIMHVYILYSSKIFLTMTSSQKEKRGKITFQET